MATGFNTDLGSLSGAGAASQLSYQANANADIDKLKNAAKGVSDESTDEELMDVCKQFESYLLEQVMKEMEKTTKVFAPEDKNDSTSKLVDLYKDKVMQQAASDLTDKQGLGIAQMMYENLKNTYYNGLTAEEVEAELAAREEEKKAEVVSKTADVSDESAGQTVEEVKQAQ